MKSQSLLNRSMSSAWASLAGKRNSIASYARRSMAGGILLLTVSAWLLGYHTAPGNTPSPTASATLEESGELAKTRQQLKAARRLIERYREELAAMDALHTTESGEER